MISNFSQNPPIIQLINFILEFCHFTEVVQRLAPALKNNTAALSAGPVCAAAADYCENAGVITLLMTYPSRLDAVAWWTSARYVIRIGSMILFI
jgi:hypothetical protein